MEVVTSIRNVYPIVISDIIIEYYIPPVANYYTLGLYGVCMEKYESEYELGLINGGYNELYLSEDRKYYNSVDIIKTDNLQLIIGLINRGMFLNYINYIDEIIEYDAVNMYKHFVMFPSKSHKTMSIVHSAKKIFFHIFENHGIEREVINELSAYQKMLSAMNVEYEMYNALCSLGIKYEKCNVINSDLRVTEAMYGCIPDKYIHSYNKNTIDYLLMMGRPIRDIIDINADVIKKLYEDGYDIKTIPLTKYNVSNIISSNYYSIINELHLTKIPKRIKFHHREKVDTKLYMALVNNNHDIDNLICRYGVIDTLKIKIDNLDNIMKIITHPINLCTSKARNQANNLIVKMQTFLEQFKV